MVGLVGLDWVGLGWVGGLVGWLAGWLAVVTIPKNWIMVHSFSLIVMV